VSFSTLGKRVGVPVVARPYQQKWLDRIIEGTAKQGTAKLYKKKRKWFMVLTIPFDVEESQGEKGMGIDHGFWYPTYADAMPPDGGGLAKPRSWMRSASPKTKNPGG
jgi:hypothetical protein